MVRYSTLQVIFLAGVGLSATTVLAENCTMCENGGVVAFPDRVIPFLAIQGLQDPTCQVAADFAPSVDSTEFCGTLQAQANYCGCPEQPAAPLNECTFCPDGDSPGEPDFVTPLGDSCELLEEYISYLPADHCTENRIDVIKRNDFLCKCPNAVSACTICPDGTSDISNLDKLVPFFRLPHTDSPTCEDVRNFIHLQPDDSDIDCSIVERQAGFCGCADVEPLNICSFCPDGEAPSNGDLVAPSGDKCSDLYTYFTYLDDAGCNSETAATIQGLGFFCGCTNVQPACTLCPNGDDPFDPDAQADKEGTTCGELNDIVSSLKDDICADLEEELSFTRYRCCDGDDVVLPVCGKRQNPDLCTVELLQSAPADADCECYSFCDDGFVECTPFAGKPLDPDSCVGTPITGCNLASAVESAVDAGSSGGAGGSVTTTQVTGSSSAGSTIGHGVQSLMVLFGAWTAHQILY